MTTAAPEPENPQRIFSATAWMRFAKSIRDLLASPCGVTAWWLFGSLVVLLLGINGLNVLTSYVSRDWMTALADKDVAGFTRYTIRYVLVLAFCTAVLAMARWVEERLALVWRRFLTLRSVDLYLKDHFYHCLGDDPHVANPDQRMTDDVKAFTTMTLSLFILSLNATVSVLAFSGVLWSISPLLFFVGVAYAAAGSTATVWLGKPLVWINYRQFDREADLRSDLVQLREHSELVALSHHERHFRARLVRRIDALVENWGKYITINRNLNFCTMGYNYFIQVVPVLVVAPMYMRGDVEFGVISQSMIAFAQLLGGFSLIISQFQSISSFTAVAARVDAFTDKAREMQSAPPGPLEVVDGDDGLRYEGVMLDDADARPLVRGLDLVVERGSRLLVAGSDEQAKIALFRATAGLWEHGRGRIVRPNPNRLCFVPERPYLPPGTLREILCAPECQEQPGEPEMFAALQTFDLLPTLERVGGIDVERDWDDVLSLGEQQRFALARVLLIAPDYVMLDRIETALESERVHAVLGIFEKAGITFVSISRTDADLPYFERVLELGGEIAGQGAWTLHPAKVAQPLPKAS
jgi:vitamin B12/bleomycin/antimicrobial peptide transport system ATP-binding/permease protein